MMPGFIISLPGKILSAIAIVSIAYGIGQWQGRSAATAKAEARAVKLALERIQELEKNNAEFKSLDAHNRCLVFARDSGLQDDICD